MEFQFIYVFTKPVTVELCMHLHSRLNPLNNVWSERNCVSNPNFDLAKKFSFFLLVFQNFTKKINL